MTMSRTETQISNLNHLTEFNVMQTSNLKYLMVISHWTKRNWRKRLVLVLDYWISLEERWLGWEERNGW